MNQGSTEQLKNLMGMSFPTYRRKFNFNRTFFILLGLTIICVTSTFSQEDTLQDKVETTQDLVPEEPIEAPLTEEEQEGELLIGYEADEVSNYENDSFSISTWWWLFPILLLLTSILLGAPLWFGSDPALKKTGRAKAAQYILITSFALLAGIFVADIILAQQAEGASNTTTRVRIDSCEVGSSFRIRILGPRNNDLMGKKRNYRLFNQIRPGLRVDSNAKLVIQSTGTVAAPYSGTVTATIYRGPAGQTQYHRLQGHAANKEGLKAVLQGQVPPMPAPAGLSANNKQKIEVIRVVVHWKPDNIDDECMVEDKLTIVWRYNAAPRNSSYEPLHPSKQGKPPSWRSKVRYNPIIHEETTGFPGDTNYATETAVIFSVNDGFKCCDIPDKQYAIIQFVRHRWKYTNGPWRSDPWNLDGPSSQAFNHAQGNPYNPTYASSGSSLLQLGPWDHKGGDAISVTDYPGLLSADHNRFLRRGGIMEWEFWTLLVCNETPATATQYLSNARVQAITHFKIRRGYPGNGEQPLFKPKIFKKDRKYFKECVTLATVLRERNLLNAFNNPRPHVLPLGQ
ncbi:MAG: hypothetical protein ACR2MT_06670 [Aurantibacter sp.]